MSDLQTLIANFDGLQLEALYVAAEKIAITKAEKWTGWTIIEFHSNQGNIGDIDHKKGEKIRIGGKKRKVRSRGLND